MIITPSHSDYAAVTAAFDPARKTVTIPAGTPLQIDLDDHNSHPQSNFNQARRFKDEGLIGEQNGRLECLMDLTDLSPSAAWVLISGTAGSGWTRFIIREPGHPLDGSLINELREAPPPPPPPPPVLQPISLKALLDVLSGEMQERFTAIRDYFEAAKRLVRVEVRTVADFNGNPSLNGPGVYVVYHNVEDPAKVLYIGKSGKWRRPPEDGSVVMNNGRLADRTERWTPYVYQKVGDYANHFEYGPNFPSNGEKPPTNPANYRKHVPLAEIVTHCFLLAGMEREVSPAFLETLLMQIFLQANGDLPPANREL
jgi:hypothetical protein